MIVSWPTTRSSSFLVTIACGLAGDVGPLAEGRRVVLIDPRGRSRSDPPDDTDGFSIDTLVDDLETVRKAVGAEHVSVFGSSASGAVASR